MLGFIAKLFKPAVDLIDNLHTSDEERMELKQKLRQTELQFTEKIVAYETKLLKARADSVLAEAQGQSWLQRNWRPITMITFLVLVVCDSFGVLAFRLSSEAWTLLKIGLGGYVIGRSAEKIAPNMKEVWKK